jgi:ParB-like chromosome segregation protein Spo0J
MKLSRRFFLSLIGGFCFLRFQKKLEPGLNVIPIKQLKVKKSREYTDYVLRLARSIERIDLVNPVIVRQNGECVDGKLRIQAMRNLGYSEVLCFVIEDGKYANI